MQKPAARLITLILLLQSQPNQKAAALAQALGISVRTLHRYFATLDEMGIPIYSERGPNGGFSLVRGYKMPPLILTPAEATALYLGVDLVQELWGDLYHAAAQSARAKLDNLLPDLQRQEADWARRSLVATGMHRIDPHASAPTLDALRHAMRARRQVIFQYASAEGGERVQRRVDPYAVVHRWGWWYMVGYCHLRQAMRTFRVDRIECLQASDQAFDALPAFDILAYLAEEAKNQPSLTARMQFSAQAAHVAIHNRSYWESVEQQSDGSVVVTMRCPTIEWAASSALAYGAMVKVLEPDCVSQLVKEWAQQIAAQYDT